MISQKIQNMGFVCAVLVVCIHCGWPAADGMLTGFVRNYVENGVAKIAVPFFFIVFGYFISAHFSDRSWWRKELVKRIKSLLVPYLLWSCIGMLLGVLLSSVAGFVARRPMAVNQVLSRVDIIQVFGLDLTTTPNNTALWYVRCLLMFATLSPVFKFLVSRGRWLWLAGCLPFSAYRLCLPPSGVGCLPRPGRKEWWALHSQFIVCTD